MHEIKREAVSDLLQIPETAVGAIFAAFRKQKAFVLLEGRALVRKKAGVYHVYIFDRSPQDRALYATMRRALLGEREGR